MLVSVHALKNLSPSLALTNHSPTNPCCSSKAHGAVWNYEYFTSRLNLINNWIKKLIAINNGRIANKPITNYGNYGLTYISRVLGKSEKRRAFSSALRLVKWLETSSNGYAVVKFHSELLTMISSKDWVSCDPYPVYAWIINIDRISLRIKVSFEHHMRKIAPTTTSPKSIFHRQATRHRLTFRRFVIGTDGQLDEYK